MPNKALAVTTSGVLLAAVLVSLLLFARRNAAHKNAESASAAQTLRAAWREQNTHALMALSAVQNLSTLSVAEQERFNRAGDDPEQMRQALIRIHEDRLANASLDLKDAQERKRQLQASGTYKIFADQPQAKDFVQLANEDEKAATSQVALYAQALSRLLAWSPTSYANFAASHPAGAGGPSIQPAHTSSVRQKPNPLIPLNPGPQVPMNARPTAAEPTQIRAAQPTAFPAQADLASAAHHPSVTVYADDQPPNRRSGDQADFAARQRAEGEIQETLRRWSRAMLLNDPKAEAAEYAPHMDRYFLRKNVDKAFVQADKAAYLKRGNRTAGFALRDVTIEDETGNTADVRLIKDVTWQRGATGEMHKLIRSRLQLQRFSDGWKISGEQDFRQ